MTEEVGVAGFIDVETTGLDPLEHEVVEFSMAIFRFNRETGEILETIDEYTGQREPGRSIPRAASEIHGLTKRNLKGKTLDQERMLKLADQCEFLIAHNASFDRSFVGLYGFPWYCSMSGIDWRGHGYKSRALQELLWRHSIKAERAHSAASDVRSAIKLLSKTGPTGVPYMKELLNHGPLFPATARSGLKEAAVSIERNKDAPMLSEGRSEHLRSRNSSASQETRSPVHRSKRRINRWAAVAIVIAVYVMIMALILRLL